MVYGSFQRVVCGYIMYHHHRHLFYHQNAKSLGACTMCILLFISICKYAFSLLCMKGQALFRHIAVHLAEVQHTEVGKYNRNPFQAKNSGI